MPVSLLFVFLFVCRSVCQSLYLSLCSSFWLSLDLCLSVCPFGCLFFCLSVCVTFCLFACVSVFLLVCLPLCSFNYLFYEPLFLSVFLPECPSVSLSDSLFVFLFVYLSLCLSFCLSVRLCSYLLGSLSLCLSAGLSFCLFIFLSLPNCLPVLPLRVLGCLFINISTLLLLLLLLLLSLLSLRWHSCFQQLDCCFVHDPCKFIENILTCIANNLVQCVQLWHSLPKCQWKWDQIHSAVFGAHNHLKPEQPGG